jgi:hypothetical protein
MSGDGRVSANITAGRALPMLTIELRMSLTS